MLHLRCLSETAVVLSNTPPQIIKSTADEFLKYSNHLDVKSHREAEMSFQGVLDLPTKVAHML